MSETRSRPSYYASASFSFTTPDPFPAAATRSSLKRSLTSGPEHTIFAPAEDSFNPRPYLPNPEAKQSIPPPRVANGGVVPQADPKADDPGVLMIHPPFLTFPDSHLYPQGLTYAILSENPEWFLDPADFFSEDNNDPSAISYPAQLEPPRGWCPAKKKDLRERGPEGWPEGEEPRLRCTFCRRTYAGVNAKSMWRRHVFEKHKIAMANRREGFNGRRGTAANKENRHGARARGQSKDHSRQARPPARNGSWDPNVVYGNEQDASTSQAKAKLQNLLPDVDEIPIDPDLEPVPPISYIASPEELDPRPSTPELSQCQMDSQTTVDYSLPVTPRSSHIRRRVPSPTPPATLLARAALIPPSPYDPAATPSFRHSPARLPSEQPWRFPSHPLRRREREMCLGSLVRGEVQGHAETLLSSPCVGLGITMSSRSLVDSSPLARVTGNKRRIHDVDGDLLQTATLFSSPAPLPNHLILNSPLTAALSAGLTSTPKSFLSSNVPPSTSLSLDGSLLSPSKLNEEDDPFADMYSSWIDLTGDGSGSGDDVPQEVELSYSNPVPPPDSSSPGVEESPTVQNTRPATGAGIGLGSRMGAGFMDAFLNASSSRRKAETRTGNRNDTGSGELSYPPSDSDNDERDVEGVIGGMLLRSNYSLVTPPRKKRRTTP